jgi:hypothetical protein
MHSGGVINGVIAIILASLITALIVMFGGNAIKQL